MAIYVGNNGVVKKVNDIEIGKGSVQDHIDTVLVGQNGTVRKILTIHDLIDHIEVVITSKGDNINYTYSSNSITAKGLSNTEESKYDLVASFRFVLRNGHHLLQFPATGEYLHNHYNFSLNVENYIYNNGYNSTNHITILGKNCGMDYSGSSHTERVSITPNGSWLIYLYATRCDITVTFNSFYIDGISYPIRIRSEI